MNNTSKFHEITSCKYSFVFTTALAFGCAFVELTKVMAGVFRLGKKWMQNMCLVISGQKEQFFIRLIYKLIEGREVMGR